MLISLAKAFKMSISATPVMSGKRKGSKPKRKDSVRLDNFDKEAVWLVIHYFYRNNVFTNCKKDKNTMKEKDIDIGKNSLCKILPEIEILMKII